MPYAKQAEQALQVRMADNAGFRYYPLLPQQQIELLSMDRDLKNFSGGITDGRHGYMVTGINGLIARIQLCNGVSGI